MDERDLLPMFKRHPFKLEMEIARPTMSIVVVKYMCPHQEILTLDTPGFSALCIECGKLMHRVGIWTVGFGTDATGMLEILLPKVK